MLTHLTTDQGSVETEFIIDYSGEEPRRLVRFTLDEEAVFSIRHLIYQAGNHGQYVNAPQSEVQGAYGIADYLRGVEVELNSRSLFSMEEFKATKPKPEDQL